MAEVFKARTRGPAGFQRDVVIKRLLPANIEDLEFVNMFSDEARILGCLHHQNVVQALDFAEDDGGLFLVLEYVEGPSLARVLRTGDRKVPPAVVAYIGREICRALAYVHEAQDAAGTPLQLVHRDVTPSNIIVTPTGTVKLLDFGIAKFVTATQLTRAGTVKGKSAYLAPEQLEEGKPIDGRVDLFALGIVLHELLTRDRLFAGQSDLSTIRKILEMEIPTPSSKHPEVPPELDRIVMRALERDPSRRYASAAEMARDLDGFVVAAHLRVDEIVAFVRDVETEVASGTSLGTPWRLAAVPPATPAMEASPAVPTSPATMDEHHLPTRRDLRLPVRMWMGGPAAGRRRTLVAGLGFALGLASALGFGMKFLGTHNPAIENAPPTALECRAPPGHSSAPIASFAAPQASPTF
jgi:eukaryotic-like serine/threonine-protein kinase